MQTVLGLVIHRFDIHIKRETGCFDVRGSRSQGTAEVAHFFFLLTQHGGVCVCGGGGHGDRVYRDRDSRWGALIIKFPPTSPPTNHLLMPDP